MPRPEPTSFDLRSGETHDILSLILADGVTTKYLGTATKTIGGQLYNGHIIDVGQIHRSLTQAVDNVQLSIQNVDRAIGLTLNDTSKTIIGASAVLSRIFLRTDGSWQAIPTLTGEISDVKGDEQLAQVTLLPDTAPNLAFISDRLVQDNCPFSFKDQYCRYVGALATCNKKFQSDGGCSGRANQKNFGGAYRRGTLGQIIHGDVDTDIQIDDRLHNGNLFPNPIIGNHRNVAGFRWQMALEQ